MAWFPKLNSAPGGDVDSSAVKQPLQDSYGLYQHRTDSTTRSTAKHWNRTRHGIIRLFFQFFVRWLLTAILAASAVGVLVAYQNKGIMNSGDKHILNFLLTGLGLGLGVNLGGALVHMADKVRWRIMWKERLPVRLFDLVMQASSQTKVMKLLWKGKGKWRIVWRCSLWLALNIAAQVAVALLGLTYEIDNPMDIHSSITLSKRGPASIVPLTHIGEGHIELTTRPKVGSAMDLAAQRSAANTYGQFTSTFGENAFHGGDSTNVFGTQYRWSNAKHKQKLWGTRFVDYPLGDLNKVGVAPNNIISWRGVESSAVCYNSHAASSGSLKVQFGTPSTLNFTSGGEDISIEIPNEIFNTTTYISDTQAGEKDRTTRIWVYWSGPDGKSGKHIDWLFQCFCYITPVFYWNEHKGPVREELRLPDEQAKIVAGAIGWSAFTSEDRYGTQTYATTSRWSFDFLPAAEIVADEFISRFAIGVFNAMQIAAPRIRVNDALLPESGVVLVVKWIYAAPVLGGIVGAHFLLLLVTLYLVRKVVVLDDGALSMALFARPLLRNIPEGTGAMLSSEEIALEIERGGKGPVTYSWVGPEEDAEDSNGSGSDDGVKGGPGIKYLRVTSQPHAWRRPFPDGLYD